MDTARHLPSRNQELRFSSHTRSIASEGAAGWAIADAAGDALDRGEDVISLCLGDTSFDTPQRISEVAVQSIRGGRTHYAPVPGTPELRRHIASAQSRFDQQDWNSREVTVFAGAQNALFAAVMTVAGADEEVLYFEPWYATYEATIRAGGATPRPVKMNLERDEKITREFLDRSVGPKTRAILLNSPNNPGGYVLSIEDLRTVAEFAEHHNLWIISDEVYRSAVFDGEFTSIASLPRIRERTILVNSLSKSHAMTGWRVGWTLAPVEATTHLQNFAQCMLFGSPTFVQDAATAALSAEGDHEMCFFAEELRKRRDLMCARLSEIASLAFIRPAGGMFCFVDVSATGLTGGEFAQQLYDDQGLALVPGVAFGPNMSRFVRISFSGSEDVILKGMDRLAQFCSSL